MSGGSLSAIAVICLDRVKGPQDAADTNDKEGVSEMKPFRQRPLPPSQ